MKLLVPLKGSIQNPTFSPDGKAFLFTRYRGGYSLGAADIYIADIRDRERVSLVTKGDELAGQTNTTHTGFHSTWHPSGVIVFASDAGGPLWPHTIRPDGSDLTCLPGRGEGYTGTAATLSPSGDEFAFENHKAGSDAGEILVCLTATGAACKIVSKGDSRNPSWAPDGKQLAWQVKESGNWRIAVHDLETADTRMITPAGRDYAEPSWHPESNALLCRGDNAIYEVTTTGRMKVAYPVEHPRTAYIGMPSWCPETISGGRRRILCEGTNRDDPNGGPGTWLELY